MNANEMNWMSRVKGKRVRFCRSDRRQSERESQYRCCAGVIVGRTLNTPLVWVTPLSLHMCIHIEYLYLLRLIP